MSEVPTREQVVTRFLDTVYDGNGELAAASFNEMTALTDATDLITVLRAALSEARSLPLAAKLGSIVVHVEEFISTGGHEFDVAAIRTLMAEPDVLAWLEGLRNMGLLPEKRS